MLEKLFSIANKDFSSLDALLDRFATVNQDIGFMVSSNVAEAILFPKCLQCLRFGRSEKIL